jgi:hypothetical protein
MTIGSFSVRAVTADGRQLVNCAAISTGPAAALACVKRGMGGFPDGTRFFVRGGAPRRPHSHAGEQLTGFWLDEAGSITPEQIDAVRHWGQIERFDEDPKDAFDEYRAGNRAVLWLIAFFAGMAAMQALRWMLS